MHLIAELDDKDLGLEQHEPAAWKRRVAVRAIIQGPEGKIAVVAATKIGIHKIPGGGVEEGEDLKVALLREAAEEAGCDISIKAELGRIRERRHAYGLLHDSYCFLCDATGVRERALTDNEREQGFELRWLTIDEAISAFERDRPADYSAKFMSARDLRFIKAAAQTLQVPQ